MGSNNWVDPPPVEPGDYAEETPEPEEKPEEEEEAKEPPPADLPNDATEEDIAFAELTGWTHYYTVY